MSLMTVKKEVQTLIVPPACAQQKLISFLKQKTKGEIPYSALMRLIRRGEVRVNKRRSKPFYRLQAGDEVRIPPYYASQKETAPPFSLHIVFEDKNLLVLEKPAGLALHKGSKTPYSLQEMLLNHFADKDFVPTPVHRLDKETSGLLLLAKNFATLTSLQKNWSQVEKRYLAWVKGEIKKETILEDYLLKTPHKIVFSPQGKKAISRVKPLLFLKSKQITLLEIKILTGRTRQIRAQLGLRNHPLLGDKKFKEFTTPFLALHAYYLKLPSKALYSYPSWPTPYWQERLKKLI